MQTPTTLAACACCGMIPCHPLCDVKASQVDTVLNGTQVDTVPYRPKHYGDCGGFLHDRSDGWTYCDKCPLRYTTPRKEDRGTTP